MRVIVFFVKKKSFAEGEGEGIGKVGNDTIFDFFCWGIF